MEPRKTMSEKGKRNTTVTTKMTATERGIIHEKARQCGLTPSDYMRRCAIGHAPKSALTSEEMRLLQNLDGCRTDIVNFANALAGMGREQRIVMFRKVSFMLEWYKQVLPITNAVTDFINSIHERRKSTTKSTKDKTP